MSFETILYESKEGVATITLNRPDRLNAISATLAEELTRALDQASTDAAARCLILTGAGRGFCAGLDLQSIPTKDGDFAPGDTLRSSFHPIIRRIVTIEKPVIAAVNGTAAGAGASLALACDLRIASTKASFLQAFVRIGLVPDSGATYFLPRLIGYARALELAMLGEIIDAERALSFGLVTRLVEPDALMEEATTLARKLAEGPTFALALTRKAMTYGSNADFEGAIDFEADLQTLAASTADAKEGIAAFLEKRPAKFVGH
jgi:2-(1,2-epoxy-1,2-dihydrophenyl)acetyl-CoA isomerase